MRCEEVRLDLSAYVRAELPTERMSAIHRHVQGCAVCRDELAAVHEVAHLVSDAPLGYVPSATLEGKTFDVVDLERTGELVASSKLAQEPPFDLEDNALALAARRPGPRRRSVRVVTSLAVAGAVGALGIAGFLWRSQDSLRDQLQVTEARTGPVGHSMQLVNLDGPGTQITAELVHYRHDNYRLVLHGDELPPCAEGHFYEVWLVGEEGLVSAGSFRLRRDDDIVFPMQVGVDPSDYPSVQITLEPDDGDPMKNGVVVADAELDLSSIDRP